MCIYLVQTNVVSCERKSSKPRKIFQYVLCCRDYYEREVARFSHQIQSEYYYGNRSVSIVGIALKGRYQFNYKIRSTSCSVSLFFYLMIANNMLTLLLHTSLVWLICLNTRNYWKHLWVKYGKILMVVLNNIYVTMCYTLCQLCHSVTQL